jgi:hypothetical protein
MQVAVKLCLFLSRQGPGLRPFRQLEHAPLIALLKLHCKQEFRSLGRKLLLLCLHQTHPDGRLGIWTKNTRCY